jgi:hypothetical protein
MDLDHHMFGRLPGQLHLDSSKSPQTILEGGTEAGISRSVGPLYPRTGQYGNQNLSEVVLSKRLGHVGEGVGVTCFTTRGVAEFATGQI